MDGMTDSLDLVPIAAYKGKGKRSGVYGAYLLAAYDDDEEVFQAITKVPACSTCSLSPSLTHYSPEPLSPLPRMLQIGTGFSDEVLQSHTKFFDDKGFVKESRPLNVSVGSVPEPDVWLEPSVVRSKLQHHPYALCTLVAHAFAGCWDGAGVGGASC